MRSLLALVAIAVASSPACERIGAPRGHVYLHVDTDAPVDTGSIASVDRPLALFDRLRFDVVPPGANDPCAGCTNEFSVTAAAFAGRNVSIQIPLPPGQAGWTARVRLFRLELASSEGEPNPDTAIDVMISLPVVGVDGPIEATVVLHTDDVGKTDQPAVTPVLGAPGPSLVNSWIGAQRQGCGDPPPGTRTGMVCVPGGAFWMGERPADFAQGTAPGWHRLVVVAPFFLDATEMTVSRARPVIEANGYTPILWTGSSTGGAVQDWCTYTHAPGPRDALPLNCVDTSRARKICSHLVEGGDLPTEAQLEYVIGGLAMNRFVWGMDLPSCTESIWGRNGFGFFNLVEPKVCLPFAKALGALGGPEAPGSAARDTLSLPGGKIVDLVGNVSEWARDYYAPQTDDCWSSQGVLVDPYCSTPSTAQEVNRGGSWGTGGLGLEAAARQPRIGGGTSPYDGFRCMAPAVN
jgi:formylglycine-generating enzyme required for sulfatase activity